jgi:hypothetical protein
LKGDLIMVFVIVGIAVAVFIACAIWGANLVDKHSNWEECSIMLGGGALVVGIIALMAAFILGCCVSGLSVIDAKIAMYQEENSKIEEQIATVVSQYQEYESDIFESVAPESAVTLVALYPELKSDTLVQKQIDVYLANNEKIKALKEEKIGGSVLRWWLYFGG